MRRASIPGITWPRTMRSYASAFSLVSCPTCRADPAESCDRLGRFRHRFHDARMPWRDLINDIRVLRLTARARIRRGAGVRLFKKEDLPPSRA
ncbi:MULTISPECIES: zinc finger domain-containing protein [Streptomyces]|uniref:zinc finger domain-containing protein n=1 Tax=Streptomyces TaxID=1883 RepID=UPI003D27C292